MPFSRSSVSPVLRVVACSAASLAVSAKLTLQTACGEMAAPMPALSASSLGQDCSLARRLLFPYTMDTRSFAGSFAICFLIAAFLAFAPRHVLRRFLRLGVVEQSPSHVAASPRAAQKVLVEEYSEESEQEVEPSEQEPQQQIVAEKVVVQPVVETVKVESVDVVAAEPIVAAAVEVSPIIAQVEVASAVEIEPVVQSVRVKSFAEVAAAAPKKTVAPPPGFASKSSVPADTLVAPSAPSSAPVDWHSSSRSVLKLSKKPESVAVSVPIVAGTVTYARGPDGTKGFALARRSMQ